MTLELEQSFVSKMQAKNASETAIKSFSRAYHILCSKANLMLPEQDISPIMELPTWTGQGNPSSESHKKRLNQTVVIKLNGGLGTSMGLQTAKSLLHIREGYTFLDLIVKQNNVLRAKYGVSTPLVFMNSYNTSEATMQHLQQYPEYQNQSEVELMQNFVPKVLCDGYRPATYPCKPELEWCPPGHGDLYSALYGSGRLDALLRQGVKYAFISNSDNLGATLDPDLLAYFATTEAPFLMEVTTRTPVDRKGGHLATRRNNNQLVLREIAQCPTIDLEFFQDIKKHQFFNTNNLWLCLKSLKDVMEQTDGVLPLPIIANQKTLNPRDSNTASVYQLEVAMGAAIECFSGAAAVCVERSRFAPVKTTSDLVVLRSDAYQVSEEGRLTLAEEFQGVVPTVDLPERYKFVDSLEDLEIPTLKF